MKPLSAEKHESGTEARKRLGWPDLTEEQQRKNYEDSGMDYRPYEDSAGEAPTPTKQAMCPSCLWIGEHLKTCEARGDASPSVPLNLCNNEWNQ